MCALLLRRKPNLFLLPIPQDQADDGSSEEKRIQWADCFILVYSICDRASFNLLPLKVQFIRAAKEGQGQVPIIIVGNKRDLQRGRVIPRWNVSNLVKKTWKCGYIECSAKYNWHILLLFSELLKSVGCARCKHVHTTIRFQGALRRNRCTIM